MWTKILFPEKYLNLKLTLNGGQCFRWRESTEGQWTGVLGQHVVHLRWAADKPDNLEVCVQHGSSKKKKSKELPQDISDYLRLDTELEPLYVMWAGVDPNFKKIVANENFQGIRILKQDPVENLFSFICSSNNHISRISSMVEKLCSLYGSLICTVDGHEMYSFPSVEVLAKTGVEKVLRNSGFGYRAEYIHRSAEKIMQQGGREWVCNLAKLPYAEAKEQLVSLPGIGAKIADCICLMSLGHLQAVPVDTHVFQIAKAHYTPHLASRKTVTTAIYSEITSHFQQLYGPLAGWAHTVLFCADLKMFKDSATSSLKREKLPASKGDVNAKKKKK